MQLTGARVRPRSTSPRGKCLWSYTDGTMVVHFRQPNCLSGVVCNGGRGGSGLFAEEEFINLSVTELGIDEN